MEFVNDLANRYKVMSTPFRTPAYRDSFMSGKSAIIMDGNWMKSTFSLRKNFNYAGALMPLKKTRDSWVTTSLWAMSPLSKNKSLAWEFISYISSMEKHMEMDKWGTDKGILLPPMKAAYKNKKWNPGPVTSAAVNQLEYGRAELIPQMAAFYQLVWPQVLKVIEKGTDPKLALDQIVAPAKRILSKKSK
jgi:ABC-type glycerol-3-phosphate transport system substrate-binding protein